MTVSGPSGEAREPVSSTATAADEHPAGPPDASRPAGAPRLSVVVTVVDGGATLRNCLAALAGQEEPPTLEVLVPYDDSIAWVADLKTDFPDFRFVSMGVVATERPAATPAGQHELFDRRRAAGLAVAGGELLAILEDRGVPDRDWAANVDRLHRELPHAVIGGPVECGVDSSLAWAVYFCDFSRYQLPFRAGPRPYVTDVNICYKGAALRGVRELWEGRYHETTVNWHLTGAGETLYLSTDFVVRQMRVDLRLSRVLHERYDWGRLFACTRARELGAGRRVLFAFLSPMLPVVLLVRHTRTQARKRVNFRRFVRVAPLVAVLLATWSAGELVGYITGRA